MTKTDMKTTRVARLQQWFAARSIPAKEKSYISQLMNGKAPFGEKTARRLELDYGMDPGFLDIAMPPPSAAGAPGELPEAEPPADEGGAASPLILAYINLIEMELVSDYRESTDIGRRLILTTAKTAKKRKTLR